MRQIRQIIVKLTVFVSMILGIGILATLSINAAEWQSGDEIRAALIGTGNETTGRSDGARWVESYESNGTIKGTWNRKPYAGKWSINGDLMCLDYSGTSDDYCGYLAIKENTVFWWNEDGEPDGETKFIRK